MFARILRRLTRASDTARDTLQIGDHVLETDTGTRSPSQRLHSGLLGRTSTRMGCATSTYWTLRSSCHGATM